MEMEKRVTGRRGHLGKELGGFVIQRITVKKGILMIISKEDNSH